MKSKKAKNVKFSETVQGKHPHFHLPFRVGVRVDKYIGFMFVSVCVCVNVLWFDCHRVWDKYTQRNWVYMYWRRLFWILYEAEIDNRRIYTHIYSSHISNKSLVIDVEDYIKHIQSRRDWYVHKHILRIYIYIEISNKDILSLWL